MKNFRYEVSPHEKAILSENKAVEIIEGATFAGGVPNGMEIHDLDWNGKKIEVKMSSTYPIWNWILRTKQVEVIDYLLLMGYEDDEFRRAFLIPKKEFENRNAYRGLGFRIFAKRPSQYDKYEVIIKSSYINKEKKS